MPLSQKARTLLESWGSTRPANAIELRNFKAFGAEGSGKIPLKPITLIFGQNSAGKSSILHSLLWLDHGVRTGEWDVHHPRLAGDLVDLGGFSRFVHRHEQERTISITLDIESPFGPLQVTLGFGKVDQDDEQESEEYQEEIESRQENQRARRQTPRAEINLPNEIIGLRTYEISHDNKVILRFNRRRGKLILSILALTGEMILKTISRVTRESRMPEKLEESKIEAAISRLLERNAITAHASSLLYQGVAPHLLMRTRPERGAGKKNECEEPILQTIHLLTRNVSRYLCVMGPRELLGTIYIGPLRVYPDRDLSMVTETDRSDWLASGLFAWEILKELPDARKRVNKVLKEILGLRYEFQMAHRSLTPEEASRVIDEEIAKIIEKHTNNDMQEISHESVSDLSEVISKKLEASASENKSGFLRLVDSKTGTPLAAKDVGMGISQVIPILAAVSVLERKTICMEQPELHLHPGLQTKLADVLISSAIEQNNTLLIETHSEHLILRLLRRIRETTERDFSDWPEQLRRSCPNGIRPEDVAVLYVETSEEGSKVIELPTTPDGDFSRPWPSGFFTERSKELF